jgi:hypothetical protein
MDPESLLDLSLKVGNLFETETAGDKSELCRGFFLHGSRSASFFSMRLLFFMGSFNAATRMVDSQTQSCHSKKLKE